MKKNIQICFLLLISNIILAQQPLTISPGLTVTSTTSGTSGLQFSNLNSNTSAGTTPTKVLTVDVSGNVILGNASGGGTVSIINVPVYATLAAVTTAIPTPVAGQLVYRTDLGQFTYYNATLVTPAWQAVDLPTTATWGKTGNILDSFGIFTAIGMPVSGSTLGRLDITSNVSTLSTPHLYLRATNGTNVVKFNGNGTTSGNIIQTTVNSSTAGSASIAWKHVNSSNVATNMMSMQGDGDATVNGFTKFGTPTLLGNGQYDVQGVKFKVITGTIPSGSSDYTVSVLHGLTGANIISCTAVVQFGTGTSQFFVTPHDFTDGYRYRVYHDASNITLFLAVSAPTGISLRGSPFKILVTYRE
jgi:hypothetical protein